MRVFRELNCTVFKPDPKPEKKVKAKTPYKFVKKPTGEKALFEKIWSERAHNSQVSGEWLGEFNVSYFAHILPKGQNKYHHFKLNPRNIYLMTYEEHHNWDNNRAKCVGKEWKLLKLIEEELKEEYKLKYPSK